MSRVLWNGDVGEFVHLAVESGVAEIEGVRADQRVTIRRTLDGKMMVQHVQPPAVPAEFAGVQQPQAGASGSTDVIVKSPIVGTHYDQAKPGDPPFVRIGDVVEPGHVLCIIESMKLMNEIESEVAGTIIAQLMENGRPVEYGEALFTIRPR